MGGGVLLKYNARQTYTTSGFTGAAFAEINAQGGIYGRQIRLHLVDDGYDPERSVANIKNILQERKALALLSCVGTPNNTAITPLIEAAGIPHVAPITGAASLRKAQQSVFHVRAGYSEEVISLVQRLVGMGLKGIAVVTWTTAMAVSCKGWPPPNCSAWRPRPRPSWRWR